MDQTGTFSSVVADIRLQSREGLAAIWQMSLDNTQFLPGDTGFLEAVTRSGTRLQIPVTGVVRDDAGVLWHVVEKPLAAGTDVTGHRATGVVEPEPRSDAAPGVDHASKRT